MSETPSARRRKGRMAFHPGVDPMEEQPYKKGTFAYDFYLKDWMDGWNEAMALHDAIEAEVDWDPPDIIYLQWEDGEDETTWCRDRICDSDIKYKRSQ